MKNIFPLTSIKSAKSLEAFMNKIIDYAGLFPPAKLPLENAFENYLSYKKSAYNSMLSNFICPISLLTDLNSLIKKNNPGNISLSLLAFSGKDSVEFKKNIDTDINLWAEFLNENSNVTTNVLEIRIPDTALNDGKDSILQLIDYTGDSINAKIPGDFFIFFEGNNSGNWKEQTKTLIECITIHNLKKNNCGFKLRTGGVSASAFPPEDLISFSIRNCLDRGILMKCTAGLHHPLTHFNESVNTKMYGFLNVFGAGVIAKRHNVSEFEMNKILTDENPDNFIFNDENFSWNDYEISVEDIIFARENLMISFGSCSFDEPVDDLKALNLLK